MRSTCRSKWIFATPSRVSLSSIRVSLWKNWKLDAPVAQHFVDRRDHDLAEACRAFIKRTRPRSCQRVAATLCAGCPLRGSGAACPRQILETACHRALGRGSTRRQLPGALLRRTANPESPARRVRRRMRLSISMSTITPSTSAVPTSIKSQRNFVLSDLKFLSSQTRVDTSLRKRAKPRNCFSVRSRGFG